MLSINYNLINEQANKYFEAEEDKKGEELEKLADLFTTEYNKIYEIVAVKEFGGNVHDVQAIYEDALLKAVYSYFPCNEKSTKFSTYLNEIIRNRKIDYIRKKSNQQQKELLIAETRGNGEDETGFYMEDIADTYEVEEDVISRVFWEQAQNVIHTVYTELEEFDRAIIDNIYSGKTIRGTGVSLGVCPKKVKRRLLKMSSKFKELEVAVA